MVSICNILIRESERKMELSEKSEQEPEQDLGWSRNSH